MENCHDLQGSALQAILQKVAESDQSAFRQLYHCYHKRLFHFAWALVKTKEPAEEITEDVFIKLWNQRTDILHINNLKIYLYTATKNTALNYLSKMARENLTEPFDNIDITLTETAISPEQIMITAEMYRNIQQAVESLPPRCKMIFKLIREDNLRYKEVAEILNISVNTIDAQMAIAIKRIAQAVQRDFEKFPQGKKIGP